MEDLEKQNLQDRLQATRTGSTLQVRKRQADQELSVWFKPLCKRSGASPELSSDRAPTLLWERCAYPSGTGVGIDLMRKPLVAWNRGPLCGFPQKLTQQLAPGGGEMVPGSTEIAFGQTFSFELVADAPLCIGDAGLETNA